MFNFQTKIVLNTTKLNTVTELSADIYLDSLGSKEAILPNRSGWLLHEGQRHYMNQCWLFISGVLWHSLKGNCRASVETTVLFNAFQNFIQKLTILKNLPGANELPLQRVGITHAVYMENILLRYIMNAFDSFVPNTILLFSNILFIIEIQQLALCIYMYVASNHAIYYE